MERYVESNQIAVNLKMSLDCGVFESVHCFKRKQEYGQQFGMMIENN